MKIDPHALATGAIRKLANDLEALGVSRDDIATALVAQGLARGQAAGLDWATAMTATAHSLKTQMEKAHARH